MESFSVLVTFGILLTISSSCRKDQSICSYSEGSDITITFAGSRFVFDKDGYPLSFQDDSVKTFIDWSYNSDHYVTGRTGSYVGGLGWTQSTFTWVGNSCDVVTVQEGTSNINSSIVVNSNLEFITYHSYTSYSSNNRLDSIIGGGYPNYYFEYQNELLSSVVSTNSSGQNISATNFTYDDKGRLIEEVYYIPTLTEPKSRVSYTYNHAGQLRTISQQTRDLNGESRINYQNIPVYQEGCGVPLPMDPIKRYAFLYLHMRPVQFY